jgi:hypothetical protein
MVVLRERMQAKVRGMQLRHWLLSLLSGHPSLLWSAVLPVLMTVAQRHTSAQCQGQPKSAPLSAAEKCTT